MRDILVGSTGFVGTNLMHSHSFSMAVHSSDVETGFGQSPELAVYAGVPAAMFLANQDPAADLAVMRQARENLRSINPRRAVLISTIAVYPDSRGRDENSTMATEGLPAYGANRLQLEQWVQEDFPDSLVVRLPALYGIGLKKNFLYDMHTVTPALLRPDKYRELAAKSPLVADGYSDAGNGFYRCNGRVPAPELKAFFARNDFNALAFTDSRSRYQFYNLGRLWGNITAALECGLTRVNLTTPPITAEEVYRAVNGASWKNELSAPPYDYDLRSLYAEKLGGKGGYLCSRQEVLSDICRFMEGWR